MPSIADFLNASSKSDGDFTIDAYMATLGETAPATIPTGEPVGEPVPDPVPDAAPPAPPAPEPESVSVAEMRELLETMREFRQTIQAPPPVAAVPPPAPEPTPLPDFIDPEDQFKVEIWNRMEALAQSDAERKAESEATRNFDAINEAANRATAQFAARYRDQLDTSDVQTIINLAANSPLAEQIRHGSPEAAIDGFDGLLESTLWRSEDYRNKALGIVDNSDAQAQARKQKVSALSHGASPISPTPPAGQTEAKFRPDGRMDPSSKEALIREGAAQLRASREGI